MREGPFLCIIAVAGTIPSTNSTFQRIVIMAKGQEKKKMEKKEPAKTFKEKRELKKTKKDEKKRA